MKKNEFNFISMYIKYYMNICRTIKLLKYQNKWLRKILQIALQTNLIMIQYQNILHIFVKYGYQNIFLNL
jgi:hypothetical protein